MRLAPRGQWNDPVVQSLAAFAERVLLALVRSGDESVCGDRDVTPQLAHARCSYSSSPAARSASASSRKFSMRITSPSSSSVHRAQESTPISYAVFCLKKKHK